MTKIKVSEAAKMLGVTDQFVRVVLQLGAFEFGTAFKKNDRSRTYSYVIYPEKLKKAVGEDRYKEVMGEC